MNNLSLNQLLEDGFVINNTWADKKNLPKAALSRSKTKKIKSKKSSQYCLVSDNVRAYQILAIYVNEMYGDGFYYCPIIIGDDTYYYYLIIMDGEVQNSSDCIVNTEIIDIFLSQKENSKYSELNLVELDNNFLFAIQQEYILNEKKHRKDKRKSTLVFSSFFIIISFIVFFIIDRIIGL